MDMYVRVSDSEDGKVLICRMRLVSRGESYDIDYEDAKGPRVCVMSHSLGNDPDPVDLLSLAFDSVTNWPLDNTPQGM